MDSTSVTFLLYLRSIKVENLWFSSSSIQFIMTQPLILFLSKAESLLLPLDKIFTHIHSAGEKNYTALDYIE